MSLIDLFELLLRDLVPGIFIRVILHRQLTIGFLDFFLRGGPSDAQNPVMIRRKDRSTPECQQCEQKEEKTRFEKRSVFSNIHQSLSEEMLA